MFLFWQIVCIHSTKKKRKKEKGISYENRYLAIGGFVRPEQRNALFVGPTPEQLNDGLLISSCTDKPEMSSQAQINEKKEKKNWLLLTFNSHYE